MVTVMCIGQAVQDFVFSVDEMPHAAEKYRASGFQSVGGGPAATAAVAIARLGGVAQLAARVGDDAIAGLVVAELESYGVDCSLVKRLENCGSSLSAVIVDKAGERMIVNHLDPGMDTSPGWLPQTLPDDVDAVLVDTRWPDGALHALKLAREAGVPSVLDADLPVPADGELIRAATHVAFSAPGLADYCGDADPATGLRAVAATTDAWCCVTLGRDGVVYMSDGELHKLAAHEVSVSDTLGAGDVWHGAFALGLAERSSTGDAMRFASAAAALKVRNGSGRAGCPTRRNVETFMQQTESGS